MYRLNLKSTFMLAFCRNILNFFARSKVNNTNFRCFYAVFHPLYILNNLNLSEKSSHKSFSYEER